MPDDIIKKLDVLIQERDNIIIQFISKLRFGQLLLTTKVLLTNPIIPDSAKMIPIPADTEKS